MFSLISSRAIVSPSRGFRGCLSAPWWRVCVGAALAAGACRWRVRQSSRSFSGSVVVVGFSSSADAHDFAAAWAGWCGLSLAVRYFSGVWGVSVPVAVAPNAPSISGGAPAVLPRVAGWVGGAA